MRYLRIIRVLRILNLFRNSSLEGLWVIVEIPFHPACGGELVPGPILRRTHSLIGFQFFDDCLHFFLFLEDLLGFLSNLCDVTDVEEVMCDLHLERCVLFRSQHPRIVQVIFDPILPNVDVLLTSEHADHVLVDRFSDVWSLLKTEERVCDTQLRWREVRC